MITCPLCNTLCTQVRRVARAGEVAICTGCGTWFRTPRPGAAELQAIYGESYYHAWGIDEDASIASLSKRATFLPLFRRLEAGRPRTNSHPVILDVGAATGLLLDIAKSKAWDCYALDINPYALDVLRTKFGADRVCDKDLVQCPFPEQSFDIITMTDLIEHTLEPAESLKTAGRLLKPGGTLCITTPDIGSLSRRMMGSQWLHFKEEHIQYFNRRGLKALLQAAGFKDVKMYGWGKTLTLDYINSQLQIYPHPLLTPLFRSTKYLMPHTLRRMPMHFRCGEMLALGIR